MYNTNRLYLKTIKEISAETILSYYQENRLFLKGFEPIRDDKYYTIYYQEEVKKFDTDLYEEDRALKLFLVNKEEPNKIIGILNFSQIVMNAFCSCYIGYSLSQNNEGKGFMSEAIERGIEIIFDEFGLHRIEGNVMPSNLKSIKLLEKFNFVNEGLSKHYLKINGLWQDHIHYVLLNE